MNEIYGLKPWRMKKLLMCECVVGHFALQSLEAVICVTVVLDNPFGSTWRLILCMNCHGTVSLPFKTEMHFPAEFTDFSFNSGHWNLLWKINIWNASLAHNVRVWLIYKLQNTSSQISLLWWRYGTSMIRDAQEEYLFSEMTKRQDGVWLMYKKNLNCIYWFFWNHHFMEKITLCLNSCDLQSFPMDRYLVAN